MTALREALRIKLSHAYFGDMEVPMDVVPVKPAAFAHSGLVLRKSGNSIAIFAPVDAEVGSEDLPAEVELLLKARDPLLLHVTRGRPNDGVKVLAFPPSVDRAEFSEADVVDGASVFPEHASLCLVSAVLDRSEPRDLVAHFDTVQAYWAYHILGAKPEAQLSIVDLDGEVKFEPATAVALPDGREAQQLRSCRPLPVFARGANRFELRGQGQSGGETLIPRLPMPGPGFEAVDEAGDMQANIYVSII